MSQPQVIKVDCEVRVLWKESSQAKSQGPTIPGSIKGFWGKGVGSWGQRKSRSSGEDGGEWLFQAEEGGEQSCEAGEACVAPRRDTRQVT